MKIQIFADGFHGYLGNMTSGAIFGGQELLLLETCKLLISHGHDLEVLQLSEASDSLIFEGIKIKKIKAPKLLWLQRLGFIRRWTWAGFLFIGHIDKNADWIHLHNHHFSFPLYYFKRKNQVMTGMNHGVEWDVPWVYKTQSLKNLRDRFSFALLRTVTKFSVRHLDKIISNDRFFVHFTTLSRPNLSHKFCYIPNYFDERVFNEHVKVDFSNPTVSEILNFAKNRAIVLLPKMAGIDRGTDILITCAQNADRWCLVITGVSSATSYYKSQVRELGLDDRVYFTGHINYNSVLPQIFSMAELVVIPSPCREATAIALLEALAMNKPVIAAEIGGLVEVIDNEINGILCHADASSFLSQIQRLLSEDGLRDQLGHAGKRTVNERFNRLIWTNRMLSFFK
jgi:glycosyltransferase involved in cell wall biosynthesis